VLSVGRLVEYKGHHLVIAAMPEVRRHVPNARLRIVGDGPDRPDLHDLAVALGLEDVVDFTVVPIDQRAALAAQFASADVVALLSSYESQGLVGYEAVATGTRAVVAAGTALEELTRFDGVRVVARDRPGEIAAALITQLTSPPVADRPPVPLLADAARRIEALYAEVLAPS
jgi:glycosyltransferase involved in cell wall biosynthesis